MATSTPDTITPDEFLEREGDDLDAYRSFRRAITSTVEGWEALQASIEELDRDADGERLLKTAWLLQIAGKVRDAAQLLEEADDSPIRAFLLARAQLDRGRVDEAAEAIEGHDGDSPAAALLQVEILRREGEVDDAFARLKEIGDEASDDPDYLHQLGACHEILGEYGSAMARYEEALEHDEEHPGALFRLAYVEDLHGDDERALELYEALADRSPTYVHGIVNLGVKYEDMGRYEEAAECFRKVLQVQPSHRRARLYLKDAEESIDMFYDEEAQRREDKTSQLLRMPITDFELSVRSRNVLKKMDVHTLGDLVKMNENELLAEKNFGETSLQEVKEMLAQKGLRLGLGEDDQPEVDPEVLAKPTTELDLSVRSRKCMEKLGIQTVGDLIQRTEDDLLKAKNFGQTSLTEVKQRLSELSLSLRED